MGLLHMRNEAGLGADEGRCLLNFDPGLIWWKKKNWCFYVCRNTVIENKQAFGNETSVILLYIGMFQETQ